MANNNLYEGCSKLDNGKWRLREKITLASDMLSKKPLTEKAIEVSKEGNLPVHGVYTLKIWDDGFNANGRSYKKVIPLVLNSNLVVSGFCNHPEDDQEDVTKYFAVEKNPRMEDGWLVVDFYLVGPWGKLANDIILCGGPIEISSSCLGDLDEDGYVMTDGFVVERFGDWVWRASNKLYQFKDTGAMVKTEDNKLEAINESVKQSLTILETESNSKTLGDKRMTDKLIEKTLELNVASMIKDADKIENLHEKKASFVSALSYAEELTDKALKESIEIKIGEIDYEIIKLAEKGKEVDGLNANITTLTEQKDTISKEIDTLKSEKATLEENYKTLSELYETKQYEASGKEKEYVKILKEKAQKLAFDNKKLKESVLKFEAMSNTKVDADVVVSLKEMVASLKKDNRILSERIAKERKDSVALIRENRGLKAKIELVLEESARIKKNSFNERKAKLEKGSVFSKIAEKRKEEKKSDYLNEEVESYVNDLIESNSKIKEMSYKFKKCSTLQEAQKLYMHMDIAESKPQKDMEDDLVSKILEEKGLA